MITQSDSTEDSQGRQLRVSKKLSKAISAVPRSRFQKARPNLPGCKRPDSSSVTVGARNKSAEISQTREDSSCSSELKTNEISQTREDSSCSFELKTNETFQNGDKIKTAVLQTEGTSQKLENKNTAQSDIICTFEDSCKINTLSTEVIAVKEIENTPKLNTDETFEKEEERAILNPGETLHKIDDKNATVTTMVETSEQNEHSSILNTNESFEVLNVQCKITEKTAKENVTNADEEIEEQDISVLSSIIGTLQEEDNRNAATLNTESSSKSFKQDRNDIVNIPTSTTDRSSKYPHLTSILLSKKRTEPKKEVQHKRRKKFKKGDVAPERSKMTMADLIYWNPTNTDECAAKSSTNVDEIRSIANVEEECVDGDGGESNICDSVPKLVISEDGTINIDQASLIVSRNVPQPTVTEVVGKDETTYSSFRKRPLTKHWSAKDTTIFYKALSLVGTDFGLMEKIFPHRTRRELKQKFKREEKYNIDLIDRAMYESQLTFDADTLEDLIEHLNNLSDDNSENADDFEAPVKAKKRSLNRQKTTKKSKCADPEISDSTIESLPSETLTENEVSNKRKRKTKKLPEDFLDVDDIENDIELVSEETNDSVKEKEENNKKRRKAKMRQIPSDFVDSEVIDELTAVYQKSSNDELLEVNSSKSMEISQDVNEIETSIPIEYVEDIESVTGSTLLNNVMAFEVVTSQAPATKRKKHTPNMFNRNQTLVPLGLSATNYTPS